MTESDDDTWRLLDRDGNEIAVASIPDDFWPSDISHATIWGLKCRDRAGLTEAVLVNRAQEHRRELVLPHLWPPGSGV